MNNLHDIIAATDYQNEPIIDNLSRLSGTRSYAVTTYLVEKALNSLIPNSTEEEIAEDIITFYSRD